ncbi:MAG: hypothetical protein KGI54_18420 [Pseudomonadota bacterium]|nr:hypothetical protein [Pseudomonadota bacterium]
MKYQMIFFVADRKINRIMSGFDMRSDCKHFITVKRISFDTDSDVDDRYIMDMIEKSKENKEFYIPAIMYNGVIYADKNTKILSDGKKEFFLI